MKQLNINISEQLYNEFEELCRESEVTQADMLKTLMDYYSSPFTGSIEHELQKIRFNEWRNHEKNNNR